MAIFIPSYHIMLDNVEVILHLALTVTLPHTLWKKFHKMYIIGFIRNKLSNVEE